MGRLNVLRWSWLRCVKVPIVVVITSCKGHLVVVNTLYKDLMMVGSYVVYTSLIGCNYLV